MANNSTNITGHKKGTTTYDIGNWGPDLGQSQTCGGVKPVVLLFKQNSQNHH
jgi:hypothetical protein